LVKVLLNAIEEKESVQEVVAWSNSENIASIKILEKTGFRRVVQKEKQNNYLFRKKIR